MGEALSNTMQASSGHNVLNATEPETYQLLRETTELLTLLEARLPASLSRKENQKLENALAKSMSEYFNALAAAFPYDKLKELYERNVTEAVDPLYTEKNWILDPLIKSFSLSLFEGVQGHTVNAYLSGAAQMMSYGTTKMGLPKLFEGPPMSQAIEWAEKHGAKLVTEMEEETKRRLGKVISDGINNKRGVNGLARDIRKDFSDMSKYRSKFIAQTETNKALSQGSYDRMKDMGVTGKEWVVIGDERTCDICNGNEAQGVIPTGRAFRSGDMTPPGHPGCRCAMAPAMIKK